MVQNDFNIGYVGEIKKENWFDVDNDFFSFKNKTPKSTQVPTKYQL